MLLENVPALTARENEGSIINVDISVYQACECLQYCWVAKVRQWQFMNSERI
jgi:hypothetical protein